MVVSEADGVTGMLICDSVVAAVAVAVLRFVFVGSVVVLLSAVVVAVCVLGHSDVIQICKLFIKLKSWMPFYSLR